MSSIVNLLLGIVTSIGGFVEVGSISTAAQAGAEFGFQLLWAVALAGLILAMLVEMSGRLAIVSRRTVAGAIRERFGIHFHSVLLLAELALDTLLMTAEIGGAAIALTLLTGIGFQWWVLPIGVVVWIILWTARFAVIEDGVGVLGLATLAFVVAAWQVHPEPSRLVAAFVPSLPGHDLIRYAFLAISIVGATVSPYLLNFYASGALEEKMVESDLWVNRVTAFAGMSFGSVVSMGVLVTAAMTLEPRHIIVDSYEQAALMFVPPFGRWAIALFAVALGVGCFGAAVEIALNAGYVFAQVFGWSWGVNRPRRTAARFSAAFTMALGLAVALALTGVDPLRLTMISVALTVVVMPILVLPFLVLMNDANYVGRHRSGPIGNGVLAALMTLGGILAVIVIPIEILGG